MILLRMHKRDYIPNSIDIGPRFDYAAILKCRVHPPDYSPCFVCCILNLRCSTTIPHGWHALIYVVKHIV